MGLDKGLTKENMEKVLEKLKNLTSEELAELRKIFEESIREDVD